MELTSASGRDVTGGLVEVSAFTADGWGEPRRKEERSRFYCRQLEEGRILFFPQTPFALPEPDRYFLTEVRQSGSAYYKNISYRPKEDRVRGLAKGTAHGETLRRILREYSRRVTAFAMDFLGPYARGWQLDFASFRSVEEQGRKLTLKARNDLLHVDAFPTRPTNGNRILRIFTNVNPAEPRVWLTADSFDSLAKRHARDAGLSRVAAAPHSYFVGLRRLLARLGRSLGLPLALRSPYDEFMLGFHNYLKSNKSFQSTCAKSRWEFPPNSTWIVFTDMVPHAVLSGRFALELTLIVSLADLISPERAPVHILEQLCGSRLTA